MGGRKRGGNVKDRVGEDIGEVGIKRKEEEASIGKEE